MRLINKILRSMMVMCTLLLTSCVQIQTPQLQNVYSMFTQKEDPLLAYKWSLALGEYNTHVYLFEINGQTFFANENKDFVYFDNGSITKININEPDFKILTINDNQDPENKSIIRQLLVQDALYETQVCEPWLQASPLEREQLCQGAQTYKTINKFTGEDMVYLQQYISYLDSPIILKKL